MHTKLERLLSKSLTTLEVMSYYLVVHTGPDGYKRNSSKHSHERRNTDGRSGLRGRGVVT